MNSGNSLIEIIIAIAIFILMLTSATLLSFSNQFILQNGSQTITALSLSQSILQSSAAQIAKDFWSDVSTSTADEIFQKSLSVNYFDNFSKIIRSSFRWGENNNEQVELSQLVSNPNEAFGQSDCQLSGEESWQSPEVLSGPDLGLFNQATAVFARGGIVYLSANNSNPRDLLADKNDFFIIDAQDIYNPVILSKLDTGPGLSSIAVAGNYAYLGNSSINAQLQVVNIEDLNHPQVVTNYKLPGIYSDGTTIPNTLFYHLGKIYLGTAKSQIEELHILDVGDPISPHEIGKWEVNAGINNIYISNHYAYIASPLNEELTVLDVSDPVHILKVKGFDAPGGSGNGKSLIRDREILFLGRTVGRNELFALNISKPDTIFTVGSYFVSDSVNAMISTIGRIFLGTNNKFEILNTENPANIDLIKDINMPAKVTGISCSAKTIFVSLLSSGGLRIIQANP